MAMKLETISKIQHDFDEADDEHKQFLLALQGKALKFIRDDLPALSETDQAAVAWYLAEYTAALTQVPAGDISAALNQSTTAYGLAAVELLGWNRKEL